jgi:cell division protein FtsI/penicillin-binding protein 2
MTIKLTNNEKNISGRWISFFIICFIAVLLVIYGKLFIVQVVNGAKYQIVAKKKYESKISLKPLRGLILDRKMNPLVSNANMYSFAADPNIVQDKESVANLFSSIFNKDKSFYLEKLNSPNSAFVWLERRIDNKYDSLIKNINVPGVIKLNEAHRVFNYGTVASQITGFTDIDNEGISGIELNSNDELSGEDGYVIMQKDGLNRVRPAVEYPRVEPKNGNNIVLTIDMVVQQIIEEELTSGININNAQGGKCVVMNVKTGELLGMYSLNSHSDSNGQGNNNKIASITDLYEPGSTFKLVTASGSLEEGIENKFSVIQTQGGYIEIAGKKIEDSHKASSLTFQQVIEMSSNVGTIKVANLLGPIRFYKYARDFGFGISTGIQLPGEMRGFLKRPVDFTNSSISYMAIGYEVLITALQLANAYNCVANNGILLKPSIIKSELSFDGKIVNTNKIVQVRRVISESTARTLTELLEGVVDRGTGTEAKIDNMRVAGKTGTAKKYLNGKYDETHYTSSFVGFFPADNPKILIAVIVDAPLAGQIYGGKVAAPLFKKISERLISVNYLEDLDVPNQIEQQQNNFDNTAPDKLNLENFSIVDALEIIKEKKMDFEIIGPKEKCFVKKQEIVNDNSKQKIILYTDNNNIDKNTVPDFTGMSIRQCINIISNMNMECKVFGSGKIVRQNPAPGTVVNKVKIVQLYGEIKSDIALNQ